MGWVGGNAKAVDFCVRFSEGGTLTISDLADIICATHLSSYVDSPFDGHGGLMLVGPPEALKTAMLRILQPYNQAVLLTDLNTQSLVKMRDKISAGEIRSLVMLDLQKIYERDEKTAFNIEGNLRALASEGFAAASFQSQEINRAVARCVVMGALTPSLVDKMYVRWSDTGFARRFLFSVYTLRDPHVLIESILRWEKIPLANRCMPYAGNLKIPMKVTEKQRRALVPFVKHQYGKSEPLTMLVKIQAVLDWYYDQLGKPKKAQEVMERFSVSLGKEGTKLEL